jgi:diphthamide biosynthesis methyltransferase
MKMTINQIETIRTALQLYLESYNVHFWGQGETWSQWETIENVVTIIYKNETVTVHGLQGSLQEVKEFALTLESKLFEATREDIEHHVQDIQSLLGGALEG